MDTYMSSKSADIHHKMTILKILAKLTILKNGYPPMDMPQKMTDINIRILTSPIYPDTDSKSLTCIFNDMSKINHNKLIVHIIIS